MELESRPIRVVRGPELERSSVQTTRCGERIEGESAVACRTKGEARPLCERRCGAELECREVVVRDHLRVIVRPAE